MLPPDGMDAFCFYPMSKRRVPGQNWYAEPYEDRLEMIGGTRAVFPDDHSTADIGQAMEPMREQLEAGFTTFCVKPSQFIDDAAQLPSFCRDVVRRAEAMVA